MVDQSRTKEAKRRRRGRKNDSDDKAVAQIKKNSDSSSLHNSLLIQLTEEAPTWHQFGQKLPNRNATEQKTNTPELVSKYRDMADSIYRREVQLFAKLSNSDDRWVESTMHKGTLKDRIAAMSVVVSTNPIHKFHAIDGLLQMADSSSANSRVAQLAAQALEDLFLNTFLPSSRKLVTLEHRPLSSSKKTLSPRILLLWRFEEMVKNKYQAFLPQYLTHTLREGLELHKIACLRSAGALLESVPEQEGFILQMMVNKLGDPDKKVASTACHELHVVLRKHPAMQTVMAREVQQLCHRPHLSSRALYNCITFLNQLQLSKDDQTLPVSLVNTYFRLFEVAVKTSNDTTEAAMKSRLLSALLTGVNRAHPYLPIDQEMEQHMDTIYRVAHTAPPAAATQALLLLFHVVVGSKIDEEDSKKAALSKEEIMRQDRFYRALYSTLQDPALLGTGKHLTMYFNLLYKAMKYDRDTTRVIAYAKRILCTTMHCSSSTFAASLFLLNEISKHHHGLSSCIQDVMRGPDASRVLDPTKREPRAALVSQEEEEAEQESNREVLAPLWEVSLALNHFHPSVQKFGKDMGSIDYSGDPLKDFALAPFLDKFAYRNPKASVKVKRGESVAARRTPSLVEKYVPVNDPSFIQKADVDVQDDFFHKFFLEQARRDNIKGIVRHKQTDDDEQEEEDALDAAEERNVDHANFEDFEHQWETDSEEEAFVDSLAEKIIEDSIEVEGYGPADLDDEDPDMEGWQDMYSDDDNDNQDDEGGQEDSDKDEVLVEENSDEDADAFMEGSDDSSDEGEEEPDLELGTEEQVAGFERPQDDSEEDEDSEEEKALQHALDDDEDTEDDLALVEGSFSSDGDGEEETDMPPSKGSEKTKKAKEELTVFEAVEEYEEMINKSWSELKRGPTSQDESDDEHEEVKKQETKAKKRKKKKRRKH